MQSMVMNYKHSPIATIKTFVKTICQKRLLNDYQTLPMNDGGGQSYDERKTDGPTNTSVSHDKDFLPTWSKNASLTMVGLRDKQTDRQTDAPISLKILKQSLQKERQTDKQTFNFIRFHTIPYNSIISIRFHG